MLTKKDLSQIEEITKKSINEAFHDFYDNIFEPSVEKNDRQHKEVVTEIMYMKKDMDDIKEYIKDHDDRIKNLETIIRVKN